MDLNLYTKIIRFNFQIFLTYPVETIAYILRYIFKILFLMALWSIIAQSTKNQMDTRSLLAYFLFATGIADFVMADVTNLGKIIRRSVTNASINQVFVKPVNIIAFYYASTLGGVGLRFVLALISVVVGFIVLPPANILSLILFIIFLIEAFFISFAYNILEGVLALNFTEVHGIKNALNHIIRVFSGQLVPLTFFSEAFRSLLLLTPIPFMVFIPINALSQSNLTTEVVLQLLVGGFWAFISNYLVIRWWRYSLKKYDAAGN